MVTHLPAVGVVVGRAAAGGAVWKMQAVSPVIRRWTCCRATCGMRRRSRITPARRFCRRRERRFPVAAGAGELGVAVA